MNSRTRPQAAFWAGAGVLILWGLAFCVSCRITIGAHGGPLPADERSIAGALLGESRMGLSGYFYETADEYFHKGVGHLEEEAFQGGAFQKLLARISPHRHAHVDAANAKEIIPWLWLAIRMDPHNVDLYLVASFWLAKDAGRPDVALEVLREGQCNNPFNPLIQLARGRILLKQRRLEESTQAFDAGLAFWPGALPPDSEDARYGKAELLIYRTLLHELDDEVDQAIRGLEAILELFPKRTDLEKRIAELRSGIPPSSLASRVLADMVKQSEEAHVCARPDNDHNHDHVCGEHCEHE